MFKQEGDFIVIVFPEGKTMLVDGVEEPAPNWTTSIHIDDTEKLMEFLTLEEIEALQT